MATRERAELRADVPAAVQEPRSGIRLSRIKGGERTWMLTLLAGDDAAGLRSTIATLVELDRELERVYGGTGPRVHPPPRLDDRDAGASGGPEVA
jgi:hypothetical protein